MSLDITINDDSPKAIITTPAVKELPNGKYVCELSRHPKHGYSVYQVSFAPGEPPCNSGVYFIFDENENLMKIGKASNLFTILDQTFRGYWGLELDRTFVERANHARWLRVDDKSLRNIVVEAYKLIGKSPNEKNLEIEYTGDTASAQITLTDPTRLEPKAKDQIIAEFRNQASAERSKKRVKPSPISGIYFLMDNKGHLLYIGQSIDIVRRLGTHCVGDTRHTQEQIDSNQIGQVSFIQLASIPLMRIAETAYIKVFSPPWNLSQKYHRITALDTQTKGI